VLLNCQIARCQWGNVAIENLYCGVNKAGNDLFLLHNHCPESGNVLFALRKPNQTTINQSSVNNISLEDARRAAPGC
jgi:hypothetical protein